MAHSVLKVGAATRELRICAVRARTTARNSAMAADRALAANRPNTALESSLNPPLINAAPNDAADRATRTAQAERRRATIAANRAQSKAAEAQHQLESALITASALHQKVTNINSLIATPTSSASKERRKPLPNRAEISKRLPEPPNPSSVAFDDTAQREEDGDADSPKVPCLTPPNTANSRRPRMLRPKLFKFPLSYPKKLSEEPPPPPYLSYNLEASYSIDGSSVSDASNTADPSRASAHRNERQKRGACAFIKYTPLRASVYAAKIDNASNNAAEFQALEAVLRDAIKSEHQTILITTDSQLTFDLLIGAENHITHQHLKEIATRIKTLMKSVGTIYASKVFSHRNDTCIGNQIADALCTWAIATPKADPLVMILSSHSLCTRMTALNRSNPQCPKLDHPGRECCALCLKKNDHNHSKCPFQLLIRPSANSTSCLACLAADHTAERCPLYHNINSRPSLAKSTRPPQVDPNPSLINIVDIDFRNFDFPARQTREQFLDYYETIFSTLFFKRDAQHIAAAQDALRVWGQNYRMEGPSIRRNRRHLNPGEADNRNPDPVDPHDLLAKRAIKAASLGIDARVSDISKALRSTPAIPLTDDVKDSLRDLYPPAQSEETFEPKPLKDFQISRHAVAKAIRSRSRMSHPGTLGLNYAILQNYMNWTYGRETRDAPDPRWTVFCELIALIMSGNAQHLSPMLHEVFGFFFDKNYEKPGEPISIRNIGVEETLFRIPAALVFEQVLQDAIDRNFLTQFDLGAGKKAGAEIFAKIAAMASVNGAIIAVMDVKKAFNNLRRKDIKEAVADFNNPLLTAFVHFMFERDPVVTFTDRMQQTSLACILTEGILQGNPLSVFIFALTVAFILRPLRAKFQQHSIITTFVDDMKLISNPSQAQRYPQMLQEFFQTFRDHGLDFDLADSAKTSVFSLKPLPQNVQRALANMKVRCQTDGIAPCKCPFGTDQFMEKAMSKQMTKLKGRFDAFDVLFDALLRYDANRKKPTRRTHEHYLNLVRLSFLSMPMYTLRTVNPIFRELYTKTATSWANSLISRVFPATCSLPSHSPPQSDQSPSAVLSFAEMMAISERWMQLPLSGGGLSLRLPTSISLIAYLASCIDCEGSMLVAAKALGFRFKLEDFPGYKDALTATLRSVPTITNFTITEARQSVGQVPITSQQVLTAAFNDHERHSIAAELTPYPMYLYAFMARNDPRQDHCSWPFNPKIRAFNSIGALDDPVFSRGIQIAVLRPIFDSARRCLNCKHQLDPAGLHLLNCQRTHYSLMHDTVKRSLAQCLRGLFNSKVADLRVHVEALVNRFAPLRQPNLPEGEVKRADIVLVLDGNTRQDVFITDIVSALAHTPNHRGDGFYYDLAQKEFAKRYIYYKYSIDAWRFFPLAFGRTNVLSRDTLRFCEVVGSYFPKDLKTEAKLRACFSRAITSGVAQTMNEEMRRLQLATLNAVHPSLIPAVPESNAKRRALTGSKTSKTTRPPVPSNSLVSLHNKLSTIVSRDDHRMSSDDDLPESQSSVLLSQQPEGVLCLNWGR